MISSPFDQSVSIYVISDIQITIIDVLSQYTLLADLECRASCNDGWYIKQRNNVHTAYFPDRENENQIGRKQLFIR